MAQIYTLALKNSLMPLLRARWLWHILQLSYNKIYTNPRLPNRHRKGTEEVAAESIDQEVFYMPKRPVR